MEGARPLASPRLASPAAAPTAQGLAAAAAAAGSNSQGESTEHAQVQRQLWRKGGARGWGRWRRRGLFHASRPQRHLPPPSPVKMAWVPPPLPPLLSLSLPPAAARLNTKAPKGGAGRGTALRVCVRVCCFASSRFHRARSQGWMTIGGSEARRQGGSEGSKQAREEGGTPPPPGWSRELCPALDGPAVKAGLPRPGLP